MSQTLSMEIHGTVMIEDTGRNQVYFLTLFLFALAKRLLVYARISVLMHREHDDDKIQCAWMV